MHNREYVHSNLNQGMRRILPCCVYSISSLFPFRPLSCVKTLRPPLHPNAFKNSHRPALLINGIVKLSSQPKMSTNSLKLAISPVLTLITAIAVLPVITPSPLVQPSKFLAGCGRDRKPWYMKSMLTILPVRGANQPQKKQAVAMPVKQAANDPAKLFPFLNLIVYLPYSRPNVLAAVSHQLRRRMLTTPTSLGKNRRAV